MLRDIFSIELLYLLAFSALVGCAILILMYHATDRMPLSYRHNVGHSKGRVAGSGERRFPRWLGLVMGVGIVAYFTAEGMVAGGAWDWNEMAIAVFAGFLGGSAVWILDGPAVSEARPPQSAHTVLAVLATVVILLPAVNILVSLLAFLVNRRVEGWPNRTSRLMLGLALAVTAGIVLIVGKFDLGL